MFETTQKKTVDRLVWFLTDFQLRAEEMNEKGTAMRRTLSQEPKRCLNEARGEGGLLRPREVELVLKRGVDSPAANRRGMS